MTFDWSSFTGVSVAGIPLIFVVLGLVTYIGKMGVSGRWLLLASMLIGLIFGVGYQVSQVGQVTDLPLQPLQTFSFWFASLIYGLALGLVASGVYDTGVKIASKRPTLPSPSEADGEGNN